MCLGNNTPPVEPREYYGGVWIQMRGLKAHREEGALDVKFNLQHL